MRIVLDTNVVMSALLWRGPPYRLLDAIRQRSRLQFYSSPVLLEELRSAAAVAERQDSVDVGCFVASR